MFTKEGGYKEEVLWLGAVKRSEPHPLNVREEGKMELLPHILKGLKILGNSSSINEETFSKLLEVAVDVIIMNHKISNVPQLQSDGAKEAYASLLAILVEAARCNLDVDSLSAILSECKFPSHRSKKLVTSYQKNKSKIQGALSSIGTHPPHIVRTDWTLDYCIKTNNLENINALQYLIQFHTEVCHNTMDVHEKDAHKIRFLCNFEQLQDLIMKLKDAVKQIERVASH